MGLGCVGTFHGFCLACCTFSLMPHSMPQSFPGTRGGKGKDKEATPIMVPVIRLVARPPAAPLHFAVGCTALRPLQQMLVLLDVAGDGSLSLDLDPSKQPADAVVTSHELFRRVLSLQDLGPAGSNQQQEEYSMQLLKWCGQVDVRGYHVVPEKARLFSS